MAVGALHDVPVDFFNYINEDDDVGLHSDDGLEERRDYEVEDEPVDEPILDGDPVEDEPVVQDGLDEPVHRDYDYVEPIGDLVEDEPVDEPIGDPVEDEPVVQDDPDDPPSDDGHSSENGEGVDDQGGNFFYFFLIKFEK